MLPLFLSIEGLYSYQERQEIDFTTLTEAGLFGIFGSVGSGKSSILEAISFALYGETERLNTKEKRSYNMLNLKSNQAIIDFQFLNFENKKFRFIAQWKRKKKFDDTTSFERLAYEWKNEKWIPLESAEGSLVTNLSYPNFRRTIIIPQGQFKEFLELRGKDRSEMMKEIFYLNQYDLGPNVSFMLADTNKRLENLKGALSGYEEVSEEIIAQKNNRFNEISEELKELKSEFEALELKYKSLQLSKQNRNDLEEKKLEFEELNKRKNQIEKLEKDIKEYELVITHFREPIRQHSSLTTNKNSLLIKIEGIKESKDEIQSKLNKVELNYSEILPAYQNLDQLKAEIFDLKYLIQNIEYQNLLTEKQARVHKGGAYLQEQKVQELELRNSLQKLNEEIEELKLCKINSVDLLAIDAWFQKNEQYELQITEQTHKIEIHKQQITALQSKYESLGFQETLWKNQLNEQFAILENKSTDIFKQESDLRLKQELAQYIDNLQDGKPCPLCGSIDHPSPMEVHNLTKEVIDNEEKKKKLKAEKEKLEKIQTELMLNSQLISDKNLELTNLEKELSQSHLRSITHQQSFIWNDFNKDDRKEFETKKNLFFEQEIIIKNKEDDIKALQERLLKTSEIVSKSENLLNELNNEINVLKSNIKQNIGQLQILKSDLFGEDKNQLEQLSHSKNLEIKWIETEYQELSAQLLDLKTQYALVKGQYLEAQQQYAQWTAQLQELQSILNQLLVQFDYSDIASVNNIIERDLDLIDSRKFVQDFYIAYSTLSNRIEEIQALVKNDEYTDDVYHEISTLIEHKKQELEIQISVLGALKMDIERLSIELAQKQELLNTYNKLDNRKENLKVLDNMFRGNGFVNYVSSIHLQRLCEIANQRFHRLTKNQLSLVINENNEFEVIDYLNNGYKRSVKTLSGGQGFQASLCLALALAENIQSLNKADKNFFFIDEGFGTQDTESINTVFDTLQYLHHENRVVGIISHVEELKERMPRAITIVKDMDKGSKVILN